MKWLNYHHLRYFWVVAKRGTIVAACEELHLTQPTISAQIRMLEEAIGEKLFRRVGKYLSLTDTGQLVYGYADQIFSIGRELVDTLDGRPPGNSMSLKVGVIDVLPKLVAYRLLKPALDLSESVQLVCHEGPVAELMARLAILDLDLVLSDSPIGPDTRVRAYSHLLGQCAVSIFGSKDLVTARRRRFPASLDGAPFLLPTRATVLRRSLDRWFESEGIRPSIVGEFEDSALLKVFAQAGGGLFAAPDIIEKEVRRQYGVRVVGRVKSVEERYYAISLERKVKHPAIVAIAASAREQVFA